VHRYGEQAAVTIICKIDMRSRIQGACNAGAQTVVRQQSLGHIGNQNWVANVGIASQDFFHRQIVRQVAGTDHLDTVVEDKQADRYTHQVAVD
jgi:hypothetical protein